MKQWDAFISHASEDKDVVVPLAEKLRGAGQELAREYANRTKVQPQIFMCRIANGAH
jgi:hypothetical protein